MLIKHYCYNRPFVYGYNKGAYFDMYTYNMYYTHQKSLATLDGEIVDPEITVKLEIRDVLIIHDAQI